MKSKTPKSSNIAKSDYHSFSGYGNCCTATVCNKNKPAMNDPWAPKKNIFLLSGAFGPTFFKQH